MSLDLDVKLHSPVALDELVIKSRKALCSLLKFSDIGNVLVTPHLQQIYPEYIGTFTFTLSGQEDSNVEMTFIMVPTTPGYEDPDEEGWWAGITVRAALNNPLKLALAAAMAIALAESQQSTIKDERRFWTNKIVSSPDIFLEKITASSLSLSLDEALNLFTKQVTFR